MSRPSRRIAAALASLLVAWAVAGLSGCSSAAAELPQRLQQAALHPAAVGSGSATGGGSVTRGGSAAGGGSVTGGGSAAGGGGAAGSGKTGTADLAFVGDILLADRIGDLVDREGVDAPWGDVGPILRQADLAFGNLETSLGEGGKPQVGKTFTFQAKPDSLLGLTHAGIDAVSLGNNHVLDYGIEGLRETLARLDRDGVAHSGAGLDQMAAYEPVIREANGLYVGFLSLSRVLPDGWAAGPDRPGVASAFREADALRVVKEAAARCDVLVVAIHWGDENQRQPQAAIKALARRLVDAGADVVIGHHPHVWQGLSTYKGALIAYSLGNFVFTTGSNPEGVETGVLEVEVGRDGVHSGRLIPAHIRWGHTEVAKPAEAEAFLKRIRSLSDLPLDSGGAFKLDPLAHPRAPLGGQ